MKISSREKIMLVFMGIALLGFLYYQFVFKHENSTINKLNTEYSEKVALLDKVNNSDARLKEINSEISDLKTKIDATKNKISEPLRVPDIFKELVTAAAQRNLKISNISFSGDSAVKGQFKLPNQSGAGNMDALAQQSGASQGSQSSASGSANTNNGTKTLTVTFGFTGSYESCLSLIKYYENNKKLYLVKSLEVNSNAGNCTGTLSYEMLSTASDDSSEFLYNAGTDTGSVRSNPFK